MNNRISELLKGLTESQQEAVKSEGKGFLRISAGAGSGKTEVLTRRIMCLFEQGIKPEELVAITYTTKAAAEMKERLVNKQNLPPSKLRKMEISTFHSFLKDFIGEDPFGAGLDRKNKVISTLEQNMLIDNITEKFISLYGDELISEENGLGREIASKVISEFSKALLSIRKFILEPAAFYQLSKERFKLREKGDYTVSTLEQNALEWIYKFYTYYVEELNRKNLLDFDEILIRSDKLIREMRISGYEPKRRVFLIDEFQDNNKEQFNIVKEFCKDRDSHVCVVGDEKQSIYSFMGADVTAFREFEKDKDIFLKDNFRSYSEIISFADAYLERAGDCGELFVKQNASRKQSLEPPSVVCLLTNENQSQSEIYVELARFIKQMVEAKIPVNSRKEGIIRPCSYGDIAIIMPSVKKLPRACEEELINLNIPYVISGGMGFYGRSEIKEIISFLTLLDNPNDDHSLIKLITGPLYGLNDSEVFKIFNSVKCINNSQKNNSENDIGQPKISILQYILDEKEQNLPKNAVAFQKIFKKLREIYNKSNSTILELCYIIYEQAGFNEYVASQTSELKRRRIGNNLQKFLSAVRTFENNEINTSLNDFLVYIDKILELGDDEEAGLGFDDKNVLKIMTIHKSKGLEFPIVFYPSIQDNTFIRSGNNVYFNKKYGLIVNKPKSTQNEKKAESSIYRIYDDNEKAISEGEFHRKLYVAFTRAENKLIMIGSEFKTSRGKQKEIKVVKDVTTILNEHPEWGKIYQFEDRNLLLEEWLKPANNNEYKEYIAEIEKEENEKTAQQNTEMPNNLEELGNQIRAVTTYLQSISNQKINSKIKTDNIFSLQDLNMFNTCPRKYYLSRKRIKSFVETKINVSAIGGTLVHETIRIYHARKLHELSDKKDAYEKTLMILEKLAHVYGENGKKCMLRASKILKNYVYSKLGSTAPWQTEAEVNVKFENDFFIRGFVDRVDKLENGEIQIIDYKTREFSQEAHEHYKRQLTLYMIAVRKGVLGENNCLNFARSFIAYMTPKSLELIEIEPDELLLENEADKTVDKIRSEKLWQPVNSDKCKNCGYRTICGIKKDENEDKQDIEEILFSEDYENKAILS